MVNFTSQRTALSLEAVRLSIKRLHKSNIHEQFIAYLHVRKRSIELGTATAITPKFSEVAELLEVPGGPPNKPHFLPFSSRSQNGIGGHWMNPNIPGSFAPSSLRARSSFMRGSRKGQFSLPADHVEKALENHLNGERRDVWTLASYLLRNYSFPEDASTVDDLIDGFCRVFLFGSTAEGSDFDKLFTVGNEPTIQWFEEFPEMKNDKIEGDALTDD